MVFVLCYQNVRTQWALYQEKKQRQPIDHNETAEQFAAYTDQFRNIFTEENRELWNFSYIESGIVEPIQWFNVDLQRITDVQLSLKIKGQDRRGVWEGNGFFLNGKQGPQAWFFKKYEGAEG